MICPKVSSKGQGLKASKGGGVTLNVSTDVIGSEIVVKTATL